MKLVYFILILISSVSTELKILNIIKNENLDANINNIVDRAIPQISQFIVNNDLDPLNLPQFEKKLWMDFSNTTISNTQIEPMIYKADLILHSGILKRLSNLKRYDDATLSYNNRVLKLNVSFEFTLLQGTYNFTINLVFFNLKGRIIASAATVRAKTIITFNTMSYTLSLDQFELHVGSVKVIIEHKNGLVDWLNTFIANIVTPFFKNTITDIVNKEATNIIRKHFDEINHVIAKSKLASPVLKNQYMNEEYEIST